MRIALNGWPLAPGAQEHAPGQGLDLAAHALLSILTELPGRAPESEFTLIHPAGDLPRLPEGVRRVPVASGTSAWARIRFEHRTLPAALRRVGAQALWTTVPSAPLRSPAPVLVPADLSAGEPLGGSAGERLQRALARAGAAGAALQHIPQDLPIQPTVGVEAVRLPPTVGTLFRPDPALGDAESLGRWEIVTPFVLTHNPPVTEIAALLAAWTWVAAGVGDSHALVVLGLDRHRLHFARDLVSRLDLSDTVRLLPYVSLLDLPSLYRAASVFLGAGRPEGHELRHALAVGLPIAAPASEMVASVVGPAGYLVRPGDERLLGAACLAMLVQEDLAHALRQKALARAEAYRGAAPLLRWLGVLEQAAGDPRHSRSVLPK